MPSRSHLFQYGAFERSPREERAVIEVPPGIVTVDELFAVLAKALLLPPYFGFNWNALSDCLRDFHWIPQMEIVMIHGDLPALPDAELTTYLDVLAEACESWQAGEEHVLRVVFPESAQREITRRLGPAS
jgi:hypothetical protein